MGFGLGRRGRPGQAVAPLSARAPGQHARALAFLETAARIKADRAAWTPEVLGAGWGEAGMFLATKFLPGVELSDFMATGRPEAMLQVVASLVRAVAAMHARNLAHGDLKPSNVLVVQEEASARAMLVDVPDLPPDGADALSTPAYAPSGGKAGPRERDIYALGKMAHALLVALGADPADGRLAGRLLRALPSTERDFPTLDVIAAELDRPDEQPAPPGLALSFGVHDVRNQAELLPDNGDFHVVVGEGGMSLSIVGMDQQLRLTLDAEGRPLACATMLDASPAALSWAIATRALSFAGTCSLFQGKCELAGVADLLSMPGLQLALEERRTEGWTGTRPGPARAGCSPRAIAAKARRLGRPARLRQVAGVDGSRGGRRALRCGPRPFPSGRGRLEALRRMRKRSRAVRRRSEKGRQGLPQRAPGGGAGLGPHPREPVGAG